MNEFETYSDAKKRLEEIVKELEGSSITLERSMELYEEGARLVNLCTEKLNSAKLRFTQITADSRENSDEE